MAVSNLSDRIFHHKIRLRRPAQPQSADLDKSWKHQGQGDRHADKPHAASRGEHGWRCDWPDLFRSSRGRIGRTRLRGLSLASRTFCASNSPSTPRLRIPPFCSALTLRILHRCTFPRRLYTATTRATTSLAPSSPQSLNTLTPLFSPAPHSHSVSQMDVT